MKRLSHILLRKIFSSVSNQSGFALIITLMIMASLAAMGIWGVRASLIDTKITNNYRDNIQTLYLAEAGVERAVDELKNGSTGFNNILVGSDGISGTTDDGILNFGSPVGLGSGTYNVKVIDNNDGDGNLFNDSDGRVIITSAGSINGSVKNIEVGVERSSTSFFDMAVFGGEQLRFTWDTRIDSYDSTLGAYGGSNIGSHGDIGTNGTSTSPQAIYLEGGFVSGDAFVGEGGNPDSAIYVFPWGGEITGTKSALDSNKELPSITAPTGLTNNGSLTVTGGSQQTVTGSGEYTSITIDGGSDLTISGSGEVIISTDSLSICCGGELKVDPAVTSVKIYVSDSLSMSGDVKMNDNTKDPTKLTLFGTDNLTSFQFSSTTYYYGALYAKNADISMSGDVHVFGSVIGKTLDLSGTVKIHYDEALQNGSGGGSASFRILSWREKWN